MPILLLPIIFIFICGKIQYMEMVEKAKEYIKKYKLIQPRDQVILGVSGGADSVALFRVLLSIRDELELKLFVLHVEHGIRGQESIADAEFVEALCAKYGVDFECCNVDAIGTAERDGISVEEAARNIRYSLFEKKARELELNGPVKIAVAHNANDNVETILFQMVRGTGVKGMCGIDPRRDNIIRPLLFASRNDIEEYLVELGQNHRTDSTNFDTTYDRNKIRHNIMPMLSEINPKAISHINQSAEILRNIWSAEEARARTYLKDELLIDEVVAESEELQMVIIHQWLISHTCHAKDIGTVHIKAVKELLYATTGVGVDLPYEGRVERVYNKLKFVHKNVASDGKGIFKWQMKTKLFNNSKELVIPVDTYTKWINYDNITGALELRTRAAGDYIYTTQSGGRVKLKDYFINEKVPRDKRDRIPLVCVGNEVIWIVGYRLSERFKIHNDTEQIIEINVEEY